MSTPDLQSILAVMDRAARAGGEELIMHWKQDLDITTKGDESPVTQADYAANEAIITVLEDMPHIAILSEETEDSTDRLTAREIFVIDPLDGTKNFINEVGEFAVLIAYLYEDHPVIGVVYNPVTEHLYTAIEGGGAYRTAGGIKEQIYVNTQGLSEMTAVVSRVHARSRTVKLMRDLGVAEILPMGGGGLKMCQVAEGASGIYVNPTNKTGEWDTAAGTVIVREAGGMMTDVHGHELIFNKKFPNNPEGFVVSNGLVHQEVIEMIKARYL